MILFLENLLEKFVKSVPARRRGRTRAKLEALVGEINEVGLKKVQKEHKQKVLDQEIATLVARKEYESAISANETTERLMILLNYLEIAEERLAILMDEEAFILILALAV